MPGELGMGITRSSPVVCAPINVVALDGTIVFAADLKLATPVADLRRLVADAVHVDIGCVSLFSAARNATLLDAQLCATAFPAVPAGSTGGTSGTSGAQAPCALQLIVHDTPDYAPCRRLVEVDDRGRAGVHRA